MALLLPRIVQGFGDQTPLYRNILSTVVGVYRLVQRPAYGAMIDDDIFRIRHINSVNLVVSLISKTNADITNDRIVSGNDQRIFPQADSIAGRRLPGDSNTRMLDP